MIYTRVTQIGKQKVRASQSWQRAQTRAPAHMNRATNRKNLRSLGIQHCEA